MGLFVVFEGVEGSGKSSQLALVADRLRSLGVPHRVAREPGGTDVGERARAIVLDPALDMGAEAELFLYLAARAEFVRCVVAPALARDEVVLADRYELSTVAYQGGARGLGMDLARRMNRVATGGLAADLTILMRLDPAVGRNRQTGQADRLEAEASEFHLRVAEAYDELEASDDRMVAIDADRDPADVHEAVWAELAGRWPEWFPSGRGNISPDHEFQTGNGSATGGSNGDGGQADE